MSEPLLELAEITKTYRGVVALDRVSLSIGRGEVVGLVGENGAGKSTLMRILGGVTQPASGTIHIDGRAYPGLRVGDALAHGIAFVHQELNLFDNLDVAANVLIGREPIKAGALRLIDSAAMRRRVEPLLALLGADFEADTPVAALSLAQMQLVEIAKALSLDAKLVILDEPTSSLTISETRRLLGVVADLKARHVSVIFISHRLREVEACADRVVVLRDGRRVGTLGRAEATAEAMIRLMIGRDLKSLYTPPKAPPGEVILELAGVETALHPGRPATLTLRRGEILGLAGLVGAGRTELARILFGIEPALRGTVRLRGRPVAFPSPAAAIACGVYLVPEDRKRSGLLLDVAIAENIALPDLPAYSRGFLVRRALELRNAECQKDVLDIRTPSVALEAGSLSGGNQQKVVLAKWLSMKPEIIIFDEPTRGVDVGAKGEIYGLMRDLADRGVAILMISSDMEEVIGVSDRVAVMHEGAISGILERRDLSEANILTLAVGKTLH